MDVSQHPFTAGPFTVFPMTLIVGAAARSGVDSHFGPALTEFISAANSSKSRTQGVYCESLTGAKSRHSSGTRLSNLFCSRANDNFHAEKVSYCPPAANQAAHFTATITSARIRQPAAVCHPHWQRYLLVQAQRIPTFRLSISFVCCPTRRTDIGFCGKKPVLARISPGSGVKFPVEGRWFVRTYLDAGAKLGQSKLVCGGHLLTETHCRQSSEAALFGKAY